MKLSAIIVSYNVKHYVRQCLQSLLRAAADFEMEVFVVDNASTDGTPAFLKQYFPKEKFPRLKLIENTVNVGFGKANNMALNESSGDYILFINPDTLVGEDTLRSCLSFYESHPHTGGIGVRMLKPNGTFAPESRRGLPTPFTSFCKILGLSKIFPRSRVFGRYYMRYLDEREANPIEVVSGAFMMAPHSVLNKVGGFDEDFFMYGEDIDLSYRILQAGYQNYYLPARILHYKGESTEKSSYRYVYVFYEAMLIFYDKHFKHSGFLLSVPIRTTVYLLAVYALLYNEIGRLGHRTHAWKSVPEDKYLFLGSPKMLEKARRLSKRWMLHATFLESSEREMTQELFDSLEKSNACNFVVFDTHAFSTKKILELFDGIKDKKAKIGTYNIEDNTIITNQNVFM